MAYLNYFPLSSMLFNSHALTVIIDYFLKSLS